MSYSGGTFSINTTGQPVVPGTTISAAVFNALTADLATGLSTAMLKDGTQTATAGIGFFAGTVSLPGITFGTDTATGFYRIGLNNTGYAVNGTKLLDLGTTVLGVTGSITATTTITATGALSTALVTDSTSITTGALLSAGGAGITKALWVGGLANIAGVLTTQAAIVNDSTTDSTAITNGAIQTDGGLGVVKALWVGGLANIAGAVTLQSTLTVNGANITINSAAANQGITSTTNTNAAYTQYSVNATTFTIGKDRSTGGALLAGSSAYSGVISVDNAYSLHLGTNNVVRLTIDSAGVVTLAKALILTETASPTGAGAGVVGQIAWDTSYIYICTATNDWRRVAITDF